MKAFPSFIHNKSKQRGSSLIEVMVGLLITAIGLLGILTMQAKAMQLNQNAHVYTQATVLANDMLEAIKTTPAVDVASYVIAEDAGAPAVGENACSSAEAACTVDNIININLANWKNNIAAYLPEGKGSITFNAATEEIVITVSFGLGYRKNQDTGEMVKNEDGVVQLATAVI